jgi:hypothetical protein
LINDNFLFIEKLLNKIISKLDRDKFIEQICSELSGTEFNSLMLEIFRRRAGNISVQTLMHEFETNRFVEPLQTDTIQFRKLELDWLIYAKNREFLPVTLSPLTPLGTCSVVGTVNQNKIISSTRGTEVISDATNVLQLKIAREIKNSKDRKKTYRYSTVHRHVRAQHFDNPLFSTHFSIFCMASGGYDRGGLLFEIEQLNEHISIYLEQIKTFLPGSRPLLEFYIKSDNEKLIGLIESKEHCWAGIDFLIRSVPENAYYKTIQFKIFIMHKNDKINIADGGIVDWLQKLTGNKKLRSMISAAGLELMQKLPTLSS